MTVIVRPVASGDRAQWDVLYQGYADFYQVTQTDEMRDRVWSWLHDAAAESCGLVAEDGEGRLLGMAHYRPFARPLSASMGGFLDDLFVTPEARGSGVVDALFDGLRAVAVENGWTVFRWITAEDNYRGRGMYDRIATKTKWATYDLAI
jgi:GNAT superfamily N-acetyltransferase